MNLIVLSIKCWSSISSESQLWSSRLLAPSHWDILMNWWSRINCCQAENPAPDGRLLKKWASEYVIGKLLISKSILRVLACVGKGEWGEEPIFTECLMGQIVETALYLGALLAILFSLILSERYCTQIATPLPSSKEWRAIWVSGPGGHLNISIPSPPFTALFVGGWNVEKCYPTFSKGHVNNPVISVMYSVVGIIKSFSFEVRPNF